MSSDSPHPSPEASDNVWQEIDRLLDELTGLSKSERPAAEFHAECLRRVVGGLGAAGGIFWVRSAGGPLQADARIVPPSLDLTPAGDAARQARIAAAVLAAGSGEALPPGASAAAGGDENATEFLLLLGPWIVGNEVAGVLQIFLSPGAGPRAQRGYLDFLQVVGELIVEFHRRRQLRNYRLWAADLKRLQDFAEQVHRSLDLKETAYTIANEVRQLAACDRVSVVVRQAVRCRLLAVSGVATVNRRADAVRQLERLADRVCVFGEPLWYPDGANDLPPELDRQLHAHLDESHANVLAVLPLVSQTAEAESPGGAAVGALVVERFQGTLDEPLRWNVLAVRGHCALALQHAREVTRMPLGRPTTRRRPGAGRGAGGGCRAGGDSGGISPRSPRRTPAGAGP